MALEAPALFDIGPDGAFVMNGYEAPVEASPTSADEWLAGRSCFVNQKELALDLVAPDAVDVAQWAGHITHSLAAISQANSDLGFAKAAVSEAYRAKVVAHGGEATDDIAGELESRSRVNMGIARWEFFAASGLGHLALTPREALGGYERIVRTDMERAWDRFLDTYGGVGAEARDRRTAYRQQLAVYTSVEANA